ncbi:unnamed protein product [Prorocentrum cordatum]|uniref:Epoxide hydrolase N-terminal domain-containing protein n=1 Tax=Prorocentrum cordatum TaxID=2364126 RepID=A0ABN9R093_9DINO|nr:unnamed protein product [Polarella glacialis]
MNCFRSFTLVVPVALFTDPSRELGLRFETTEPQVIGSSLFGPRCIFIRITLVQAVRHRVAISYVSVMASAEPLKIQVHDDVLDDLKSRLSKSRIVPNEVGAGRFDDNGSWSYGTDRSTLAEFVKYWLEVYDWRKEEAKLNALSHFKMRINGLRIHFVHERSSRADAIPLLLVHGWPGSVVEFTKVIPRLRDAGFHVVAPSIPGFGWSDAPTEPGADVAFMAEHMNDLMLQLGYAHGRLPRRAATGAPSSRPCAPTASRAAASRTTRTCQRRWPCRPICTACFGCSLGSRRCPANRKTRPRHGQKPLEGVRDTMYFLRYETAYQRIQGTKPQSLSFGLNDSPAGLLAWLLEKFQSWSDCGRAGPEESGLTKDDILTNVMVYWTTQTIASSCRIYYETLGHAPARRKQAYFLGSPLNYHGYIAVPTGRQMLRNILEIDFAAQKISLTAFADDTAAVIADYAVAVPVISKLFSEFEKISRLALNIKKTVFIPLWRFQSESNVRALIREVAPQWRDILISLRGKYLGYWVGPGAGNMSWDKPLEKFTKRVQSWAQRHLGLFLNSIVFNTFIISVLSFVMQLQDLPGDMDNIFSWALRRLAPGPGNWIMPEDLCNLREAFGIKFSFAQPRCVARAAKLRVIETVAPDCKERVEELRMLDGGVLQGPFGSWHANSLFAILHRTEQQLEKDGISRSQIRRVLNGPARFGPASFQSIATDLINPHCRPDHLQRTAHKLARWKFPGDEAALVARVQEAFVILHKWCPPRVASAYLRTLFNGWATRRRMRHAEKDGVGEPWQCLLGCKSGDDSIEHYRTSPEDVVRMALVNYGVYRTTNYLRFTPAATGVSPLKLLRRWVKRGAEKSRLAAADASPALRRISEAVAAGRAAPAFPPGAPCIQPHELEARWQAVADAAAAAASAGAEPDQGLLEELKLIYGCITEVVTSCGLTSPDAFDIYEACFEALCRCSARVHGGVAQELLFLALSEVHEEYDVLLSCVETYEWVQPGTTGLLRLWMLQALLGRGRAQDSVGAEGDVDVGAVSLISFLLSCGEAPFEMQEAAGRCLVQLTAADSVFLPMVEASGQDLQSQQIAQLTSLLNRHVNGLIRGIIQFDVVHAFGKCICQHQQSHTRTDVIVKSFLTTIHNCLLYCSQNQKRLRQHLATSDIVQDIMLPYVQNILPALYSRPDCGPALIEWQNLKSVLQTFAVVTFNVKVLRPHLRDSPVLLQICQVPHILEHISMLEMLIKISININFTAGPHQDAFPFISDTRQPYWPASSRVWVTHLF